MSPTYQYECEACHHSFEMFQYMSNKRLSKCPKCGKKKLVRLIGSGTGIIFKGNGFYETDYKKKPQRKEEKDKAPCEAPKESPACKSCPKNKEK